MDEGIIGVVAGIVGTLLGTVLGAVSAVWIQRRQLEHEDRTRFHDRRLAAYADFNDACNRMMASLTRAGEVESEDAARFLGGFEAVRLISSRPVGDAAAPVHAVVGAAWWRKVKPDDDTLAEFNTKMATLCIAMRAEIGVDKN